MHSSPDVRSPARGSVRSSAEVATEVVALATGRHEDAASIHAAAKLEGFREGRHEGLELGLLEGRALGQAATASSVEALAAIVRDLHARDERDLAQIEELATVLAVELAETILGRELQIAADPGADAIRRALALRAGREPVRVRLHPDDASLVDAAAHPEVEIVVDPSVRPGAALAELGDGFADLSVDAALARVREVLG